MSHLASVSGEPSIGEPLQAETFVQATQSIAPLAANDPCTQAVQLYAPTSRLVPSVCSPQVGVFRPHNPRPSGK